MNLFGLMETSGSAMQAERMRAEVVAANMANAETTRTESGGPYHRQHVVFAANQDDESFSGSFSVRLRPEGLRQSGERHWRAAGWSAYCAGGRRQCAAAQALRSRASRCGPDGYVSYPDINPLTEMVDLMGATRAYGLNSSAVQAEKGMITSALEIAKS